MAGLSLERVRKRYGDKTVLQDVSLSVADGEFVALLGPSGCGKSTLLRLIAGFERLDGGTIRIDGQCVSGKGVHVATEARRLGMVFQSYALWPHMSVAENVGFVLDVQGVRSRERAARTAQALATVGLAGLENRRPAELSGGQRQRVALARTLASRARAILLDEPLANLDANLRETMQDEFRRLHRESGTTMVFVTHDQSEALALADRVAVMMDGQLRQVDAPKTLYACPADPEVAGFIGRGAVVPVSCLRLEPGMAEVALGGAQLRLRAVADVTVGPGFASLRPEACRIVAGDNPEGSIVVNVHTTRFTGPAQLVGVSPLDMPDTRILATADSGLALTPGDRVGLAIQDGWVLPAPHPR